MPRLPATDLDFVAARTFVDVVEANGISAAARRLGLAKSVVSARVASMEKLVGANLFTRGARLTLTERGRAFYEGIRRTIEEVDELLHAAAEPHDAFCGTLRIGAPSGLGVAHLGQMICRFAAQHPAIDARVEFSDGYVDIAAGEFDVALRIGQPTDSDLVGRKLCRIRRVVCASETYLAEHGCPVSVSDLPAHHAVAYSLVQASGQWFFRGPDGEPRSVPLRRIAFMANSGEAMWQAVRAGLGVCLLPSFFLPANPGEFGVRVIHLDLEPVALELWALHARRRERRPMVDAFVESLVAEIGDPPYWEAALP